MSLNIQTSKVVIVGLGDVTVKAKGENMERPKENNLTSRRYENPNKRKTGPTISSSL